MDNENTPWFKAKAVAQIIGDRRCYKKAYLI